MTNSLPEPTPRRRWPWSSRTSAGSDLAAALALFVGEVAVFGWKSFGCAMQIWAAQGAQAEIETSRIASIAWTEHVLIATLVLAGLAALTRAPWTVLSQLLAAGTLAVLLVLSQYDHDRTHPGPAPTPSVGYSPCYSGTCQ
ncbi:DUF6234 family protein [Streptomyces gibsoniae]|uniref:DUF6234 family protein n=1 Tax=Streptomyces gibsoniae TaxID=3075529 RepID=A0ABU2U083_9ACTN|nr:DUF6234 family protein [Streptomyces sp. DSM 41699]MDT0466643.1 DUF6234 family protein [Streptomyces sp. DSM 41699]